MYNAKWSIKSLVKFCGRQYSRGMNRERWKRMNQEREDNNWKNPTWQVAGGGREGTIQEKENKCIAKIWTPMNYRREIKVISILFGTSQHFQTLTVPPHLFKKVSITHCSYAYMMRAEIQMPTIPGIGIVLRQTISAWSSVAKVLLMVPSSNLNRYLPIQRTKLMTKFTARKYCGWLIWCQKLSDSLPSSPAYLLPHEDSPLSKTKREEMAQNF